MPLTHRTTHLGGTAATFALQAAGRNQPSAVRYEKTDPALPLAFSLIQNSCDPSSEFPSRPPLDLVLPAPTPPAVRSLRTPPLHHLQPLTHLASQLGQRPNLPKSRISALAACTGSLLFAGVHGAHPLRVYSPQERIPVREVERKVVPRVPVVDIVVMNVVEHFPHLLASS